jgi:hypothetical protein
MFQYVRNSFACSALGLAAVGLTALSSAPAQAQQPPTQPQADVIPIRLIARLDAFQSIANNSTPIETRVNGNGIAEVLFDPISGNLSYQIQFQGIRTDDYTMGDPAINEDGSPIVPGTRNGRSLMGGGVSLVHFHVGAPSFNGQIPVDIVGPNGAAAGVQSIEPSPIANAGAGRITGMVNVRNLADANGRLLNNVPLGEVDDAITDPSCLTCGFIPAMLTNNTYVNIHTFNNPFGEIRGQLQIQGCSDSLINTLTALRSLAGLIEDEGGATGLTAQLDQVSAALNAGDPDRARQLIAAFTGNVIGLPRGNGQNGITLDDVNDLACGAANVLITFPAMGTPPPAAPGASARDVTGRASGRMRGIESRMIERRTAE